MNCNVLTFVTIITIASMVHAHAQEQSHSDRSTRTADSTQFSAPVDQAHYATNEAVPMPALSYPWLTEEAKRARVEQKRAEQDARRIREKE